MRTLWVDATNGAAGDMLLAALLDAGADPVAVRAGLARLAVEPVEIATSEVRRQGLRAVRVEVRAPDSGVHRGLADVRTVVEAAGLPEPVARFAVAAFTRLARAEARVHGVEMEQVHFHEVGALDAIADMVGCALALDDLGLLGVETRVVSPVAVGSGFVRAAHGRLPVPAPAVLELLVAAGAPVAEHPARRELCTPTGAALLASLATEWGPPPGGVPRTIGIGAGRADPADHPNVLRVVVGERDPSASWSDTELWLMETTVDDMDPRIWPDLLEQLRAAGVADAWCAPVLMRKGRPGQVLTVLVAPELREEVCRLVFSETPTLGVRMHPVHRRALPRDEVEVRVSGAAVRVKRGRLAGRVVTVQPEYDDALEAARQAGRPVADVINEARALAERDR